MGKTVIEKIVEHNTGRSVKPGDIVTVNVDRVMIHDIFIPFVAEKFKEMGFEKLWEEKALDIETDLPDVNVTADAELLSLVWNNLISNAVKFTPEGGKITVTLTEQAKFVEVRVSDTGCGMSAETGRHIFEKFYQGDSSHATQGNGLGLALVKRVIDIVGGEICVDSTPGSGSTFTVRLPKGGM